MTMDKDRIIDDALQYAEKVFADDRSGHDYLHTVRVVRTASYIAEKEGADLFTAKLAAALHDVDDHKLSPETYEEKNRAAAFMKDHGISPEKAAQILAIIGEISFAGKDSVVPETLEGRCVQDADRLDAIGAIGIARAFAYGGSRGRPIYVPGEEIKEEMSGDEYRRRQSSSIAHFYEKLLKLKDMMTTETGRSMAFSRDRFMREYLDEFFAEVGYGEELE